MLHCVTPSNALRYATHIFGRLCIESSSVGVNMSQQHLLALRQLLWPVLFSNVCRHAEIVHYRQTLDFRDLIRSLLKDRCHAWVTRSEKALGTITVIGNPIF